MVKKETETVKPKPVEKEKPQEVINTLPKIDPPKTNISPKSSPRPAAAQMIKKIEGGLKKKLFKLPEDNSTKDLKKVEEPAPK